MARETPQPESNAKPVRRGLGLDPWRSLVGAAIVLGLALRCVGWERDLVDLLPGDDAPRLYRFHPDEESVVSGALRYDDPLDPPFTMYGMLPLQALRAALWIAAGDAADPSMPYRVGRLLSVLFSTACLIAAWGLAVQVVSAPAAALGVLFLALAPLAVQQAHFYTVDSLFGLVCTAALAAILRVGRRSSLEAALTAGVLVGLAASVRLNAAALGGPLLVTLWLREGALRRALGHRHLWAAGVAALVVMVGLQPFLLTAPELYWAPRTPLDFGQIVRVVGGSVLQLYTLQYLHTTPLLYPWTHLLPLAVGTALTLAAVAGVLLAVDRGDGARVALLTWVGLHLLTAGLALVKPVRYLMPVLPMLLVLAADLCVWLWTRRPGRRRWAARALVVAIVAHGVVYGVAYLRVWTTEDSRVQAGRWIAAHVPPGDGIVVENGAFSLRRVISDEGHRVRALSLSTLFEARGHMPCGATAAWLARDVAGAPWMAIAEVNRAAHMAAAPEVLPVVASFYDRLLDGRLGYETVRRFKVTPSFAGIAFPDDGAESTWLGFDHPAVRVLRRRPQADVAWRAWATGLDGEPFCADATLRAGARALQAGDPATAADLFEQATASPTSGQLARLLAAMARDRAGLPPAGEVLELDELDAFGAVHLGLVREGLQVVRILAGRQTPDPCLRARKLVSVASALEQRSQPQAAQLVEAVARLLCDSL